MSRTLLAVGMLVLLLAGCGSASRRSSEGIPSLLLRQARPIGRGARFHPPASGVVIGPCRASIGAREGVHVEVFADNRVVLLAPGIGTMPPRRSFAGRISKARCYGALVTLDPTGLVLVSPGAKLDLANLFRSWGQPLSRRRLTSFVASAHSQVAVFVNGRRWPGAPGGVPLKTRSEIVVEVGPHVPPHRSYRFPPGS